MKIYEKLSSVQQSLKAPKGQTNDFGNYKYRSCEDILEAVKPLLRKQELTIIIIDELVNIGDRYYVKAIVKLCSKDGLEKIEVTAYARESEIKKGMDASQITGASSSYARKYALNGMFLIDDTKDADTMDNSHKTEEPTKKGLDEKMKKELESIKDIGQLAAFANEHKGAGEKVAKAIIIKKTELEKK